MSTVWIWTSWVSRPSVAVARRDPVTPAPASRTSVSSAVSRNASISAGERAGAASWAGRMPGTPSHSTSTAAAEAGK
ncbi:MAG: hypothetical protein OXG35_04625 [Acidobacteria bacterium]|nr:hypothetical protein [Acidobacteriota bacterium]